MTITLDNFEDLLGDDAAMYDFFVCLVESGLLLTAIADDRGYLETIHGEWESALGYTPTELTSEPFINFLHPDDVAKTMEVYHNSQLFQGSAANIIGFKNRYKHKQGGWVTLIWWAVGKDDKGKLMSIALLTDSNGGVR